MTITSRFDRARVPVTAALLASALLNNGGIAQAQIVAQPYATQGDWTVEFVPADRATRSPAQCRATKSFGTENALRFTYGDTLKAIDFMGLGSHALGQKFDVTYVFDNDESNVVTKTAINVSDNDGVEWIRLDESEDGPGSDDALSNTKTLTIRASSARDRWRYSLAGTRFAINKAIECLDQRVRASAPAVAQAAPPVQAPPSPAAQRRPADCTLAVKGKTYISGPCDFSAEKGGSFQISNGEYFAYVSVVGKDSAEASWNANPKGTRADVPLGALTRKGACWVGQAVEICARSLPPATLAAVSAARPAGEMIYPDVPGASQSCVKANGGRWQAGVALVLDNCKVPGDNVFARSGGTVVIERQPGLCVALSKADTLVLAACDSQQSKWLSDADSLNAKAVRSSEGMCWTIPALADSNAKFPLAITAEPCNPDARKNRNSSSQKTEDN